MNTLLKSALIVLLLTFTFAFLPTCGAVEYTDITVAEFLAIRDAESSPVILDVRSVSEYESGHIRNAKLIPHTELPLRLEELDRNDTILVYCRSGARSANASQTLVNNGFLYIYNLLGGILGWISEGHPVYVKYASIQEAINNATDGDTIYVSSGTYYEHVNVTKPVSLMGENVDTTIIDGNSSGSTIRITSDNVSVSAFTLQEAGCACFGVDAGVHVENVNDNVNITGNLIQRNGYGIRLDSANNITIAYNTITDNDFGIDSAIYSSNNTIHGNSIIGNNDSLRLGFFSQNEISGNDIRNSDHAIQLILSYNNSIHHNNFVNHTAYVTVTAANNTWDDGAEGNFWENTSSIDIDQDGIADSPYAINGGEFDNYPFVNPISFLRVVELPNEVLFINVASNSTVSNLQLNVNETYINFNLTGPDGSIGHCRIRIPKRLLWAEEHEWMVFADDEVLLHQLTTDATFTYLWFNYQHSTLTLKIQGRQVISEVSTQVAAIILVLATLIVFLLRHQQVIKTHTDLHLP
ncbi:MAG: right-handed parallel beta-helix repeat-containing protein [Candidatus Bathyarchaeota archaeon]|nr:MAG: right-handed parallel beta-helix repeat-containing protein [Candidatus Bathyarchaeota archaeon]